MQRQRFTTQLLFFLNLFSILPTYSSDGALNRDGKDNCTSKVAMVRVGTNLCEQETNYRDNRLPRIKNTLENILGFELEDDEVPRIALCASGGGYRAMIAMLGSLQGMELVNDSVKRSWLDYFSPQAWYASISQHVLGWMGYEQEYAVDNTYFAQSAPSLLDSCMYSAVLSGSTWTMAGWLQSRMPIADYIAHVTTQVGTALYKNISIKLIAQQLLKKESYKQDTSIVDIYGSMLAQKLLKNLGAQDANAIDITDYRNVIDAGQMPLPISTAVIGKDVVNYEWVEFTPYEVGSAYLNAFVPAWAFGRAFDNGASVDFAPPQSLGYCMGIWGSAFSVSAEDVYDQLLQPKLETLSSSYLAQQFGDAAGSASHLFQNIYDKLKNKEVCRPQDIMGDELSELRASPAQINNWTFNLRNANLNKEKTLELVDGGLNINVPFPPLLGPERGVNIIIVLDNSSGDLAGELPKAEKYAQTHGLKFPKIDYSQVTQAISIHRDEDDLSVPVVIYMPLVANPSYHNGWNPRTASYCGTFNLAYTPAQVAELAGLTKLTMEQNQDVIIQTIKEWVLDKRAQ